MTVSGIISAIIIGLIIGALGRLIVPGKQDIPIWLTIRRIVAALIGSAIVAFAARHRGHRLGGAARPGGAGGDRCLCGSRVARPQRAIGSSPGTQAAAALCSPRLAPPNPPSPAVVQRQPPRFRRNRERACDRSCSNILD